MHLSLYLIQVPKMDRIFMCRRGCALLQISAEKQNQGEEEGEERGSVMEEETLNVGEQGRENHE